MAHHAKQPAHEVCIFSILPMRVAQLVTGPGLSPEACAPSRMRLTGKLWRGKLTCRELSRPRAWQSEPVAIKGCSSFQHSGKFRQWRLGCPGLLSVQMCSGKLSTGDNNCRGRGRPRVSVGSRASERGGPRPHAHASWRAGLQQCTQGESPALGEIL